MKALVFICNHERTESWNIIAQMLKDRNYENCLIAILYDDLARGIINKASFDLVIDLNNSAESDEMLFYFKDINFREISFKDRALKYNNHDTVERKIMCFMKAIEANLNSFHNLYFIGEISWAAEELVYIYAKKRNFQYTTIIPVRFIPRRWALANALSEETFLKFNNFSDQEISKIISYKPSHPDYFYDVMSSLELFNRMKRFIFINRFKPKIPDLFIRKLMFILFNSILELFKKKAVHPGKIYYLYAFQVQPEASIDYLAPEYMNQTNLVDEIIRNLRPNEFLVLKEHPGETVLRDLRKKISYLFNKKILFLKSSSSLINNLVGINGAITVTGTIGGELAMQGIPTVSLKKMFFNRLEMSNYASSVPEALVLLRTSKINKNSNLLEIDNVNFLAYLQKNSYPGFSYYTKEFGFKDFQFINSASSIFYEMKF